MKTIKSESKKTTAPTPAAAPARVPTGKTPTAKKPAASATTPRREISTESIASRAQILWHQAGRPQGRDVEYWLQAEKQIKESSVAA